MISVWKKMRNSVGETLSMVSQNNKAEIEKANAIANPGCFTATIALLRLAKEASKQRSCKR